jgi:hypothetical protein
MKACNNAPYLLPLLGIIFGNFPASHWAKDDGHVKGWRQLRGKFPRKIRLQPADCQGQSERDKDSVSVVSIFPLLRKKEIVWFQASVLDLKIIV